MMDKVHNAEILSVGTEILLGHTVNTDASDISQMLSEIGINVKYHTVVGDNPARLADCIEIAKSRADIIISTGGLGPTCDDLTKQTLAKSFGLELEMNEYERWSEGNMLEAKPEEIWPNYYLKSFHFDPLCKTRRTSCKTVPLKKVRR